MKKSLLGLLVALLMFPVVVYAESAELSWNANTEADLEGYKVYRGNGVCVVGPLAPLVVSGNPVIVLAPLTTYKDVTVPVFDGELCYEITAYDTSGNESIRSNRATKTVNLIPPIAPTGLVIVNVTP